MKTALFAIALGMAGMVHAAPLPAKVAAGMSLTSASTPASFEAANRKSSKRVGGSGKSGKGGKYVGGRRK
ncbi:hypothetical protein [Acidovorax sp. SRB_14]|uniref:hypothetical protein n=1 Tax=Acidovorax sp. SRB_14 TaxID=1962699 RepID=UPI00146B3ADD|nr:hypothetical protein [Acidovorax sp. SRB_14]